MNTVLSSISSLSYPTCPIPKENTSPIISYWGELPWNDIHQTLGEMTKPEVILWYSGAYGLKQGAVDYYRPHISQMMESNNQCRVNLFDLAAWGALRGGGMITTRNKCAMKINRWAQPRLRSIYSADIFDNFRIKNSKVESFIKNEVLKREFIYRSSEGFQENKLTIGEVFRENFKILEPLASLDTSKAYSPLQYLEGMFLVEAIVRERLENNEDINIVFALPNDEPKYYADENNAFQEDLQKFLREMCGEAMKSFTHKINVHFMNFQFGNGTTDRPYNSGNSTLKFTNTKPSIIFQEQVGKEMSTPISNKELSPNLAGLPTAVPGFGDYNPEQQVLFAIWKKTLSNLYQLNGFNSLEVPPFVRKEFLKAKGGINNEIFSVSSLWDDSSTSYGLAFDRTVPFALWIRDRVKHLPMPFKRYDISLSFRGEKPSPGRFQGFYQCDVDVVGPKLSLENDVQCISALVDGLSGLLNSGISDPEKRGFKMYLNHISIPKGLFKQAQVPEDLLPEAMRIVDKMDKVGVEETTDNLLALLKDHVEEPAVRALVEVFSYKGPLSSFKIPENFPVNSGEGLMSLETIIESLIANGIDSQYLEFCPGMVRGLNYYTGVVFETFLDALPRKAGSVMSGGRYDELVDTFTRNKKGRTKKTGIEGVGGAIGLTRLFDVLSNAGLVNPQQKTACKVMVLARGKIPVVPWKVAKALRDEGIATDIYTGNSTRIDRQLTYADKSGVPVAVMVMEENIFCVKNLRAPEDDATENKEIKDLSNLESTVEAVKRYLGW